MLERIYEQVRKLGVIPLRLSRAGEAYLETAAFRCIPRVKVRTMPKRGCNLLRWERSWDMCWGKVLTRQPEISQARREERVGANRFFVGAPFKKCNPSGFNSTARNDVSCYATILQRAPLVARPVHISQKASLIYQRRIIVSWAKKDFLGSQRRKNIVSLRESYFPRNRYRDILSIFPDTDMKIMKYSIYFITFASISGRSRILFP